MDETTHTAPAPTAPDASGTLDEALERIHSFGPERHGWLTNHAPMAVEALVRRGQAPTVHRWLDHYRAKLEDMPDRVAEVTPANWREALGDPGRIADWTVYFERETAERPWREVLAEWWPRLLPGIAAGATHPVIRVGHSIRTLLDGERNAPRTTELAHGLGYWAARHRLGRLTGFPQWPGQPVTGPDDARDRLAELVRAATHRYAAYGHGEPIMLVHAATAPNAVLRALPALPRELWAASLEAAWAASAAVTAAYTPAEPAAVRAEAGGLSAEEVFARAAAHGDDHTIKFSDTALDVADAPALTAALRAVELNPPVF
ncbi:questin oxidase family protein [Streptomyces sp. ITFR-16]|uniref:questin oxidase family protein n=1 Tax=Streptomyces sp. ITFR-16 TaxID=3075198 RepID=UPI00288AB302|nr:questin oxidase family protein [Streptomyces sp. ITFR-16]WNI24274.1 questin oxidase family protein [Streptomyces sp. ITFR-16]